MNDRERYEVALGALRRAETSAARYRRRHGALIHEVEQARQEARRQQAEHAALAGSAVMVVAQRLRSTVEKVAPRGTRRRRLYHRLVSVATGTRVPPAGPTAGDGVPTFPTAEEPEASIVICVHDRWELTAGCLRSIAADVPAVSYEVIVVDDASADETEAQLRRARGLRAIRLNRNVGFVDAVNAGLQCARGRFVVLLNNDTIVQAGWLDALVDVASEDPEVGVVGAKLVYPDGRLQEAGGVIWNDGSGLNFGRGHDPNHPLFTFRRDVDYCSGACLLVRRELLARVGGLDPRFRPAYYEDTDLCFAARKHDYRVVYQPDAVVCHVEGASHGTELSSGVKRYQDVHQATFRQKWTAELSLQRAKDAGSARLASWRTERGRILVIDHTMPRPDHDSGSRRIVELMMLLRDRGMGVTFVPQDSERRPPYDHALESQGIEVLRGPADLDQYLKEVRQDLRMALCCRPTVAWANYLMLRAVAPETTLVYDTVDLHFLRERRRAAVERTVEAKQSASYHRDVEVTLSRLFDATWVVSEADAATLLTESPDTRVFVVPNVHRDQPPGPGFERREGLLFVGSHPHPANKDAATRLVREILPLVHAELPDVTLHLAGDDPDHEMRALASDKVRALGWVADLEPLYRQARLFVAPLRLGAGMKGKVGESVAYGLPVVTTPLGAEGMRLVNGHDVLVADDNEDLAQMIVEAYRNPELWTRVATQGRQTISINFSPDSVGRKLDGVLHELGVDVPWAPSDG